MWKVVMLVFLTDAQWHEVPKAVITYEREDFCVEDAVVSNKQMVRKGLDTHWKFECKKVE